MDTIFVAHASADAGHALRVVTALRNAGYAVWWDEQLPAHRAYYDVLEEKLRAARAIVVLWSEAAASSQWVRAEADLARARGTLVQANLDDRQPPLPFNQIQCARLGDWDGDPTHREWLRVLESVAVLVSLTPAASAVAPGSPGAVATPAMDRARRPRLPPRVAIALGMVAVLALGSVLYSAFTRDDDEAADVVHGTPGSAASADAAGRAAPPEGEGARESPGFAVLPFEPFGGTDAAAAASALADAVAGSLSENLVRTIPVNLAPEWVGPQRAQALRELGADFTFGGSVRAADGRIGARVNLEDVASGSIVWSRQFEWPVRETRLRLAEVATAVTEVAYMAAGTREQPDVSLDPHTLSMYIKAQEGMTSGAEVISVERIVAVLEQVIEREPRFAHAHGLLALLLVSIFESIDADRFTTLNRARAEAETSIRLFPQAGSAYDALYKLARIEAPDDLAAAEAILVRGVAQAPAFAFNAMRYCEFLLELGRISDGLRHCSRAVALRPLAAPPAYRYALALWYGGQLEAAHAQMDATWERIPTQPGVNTSRLLLLAFGGRESEAARLLAGPDMTGPFASSAGRRVFELYFAALSSRAPGDVDAAIDAAIAQEELPPITPILIAARLGRVDAALGLLGRFPQEAPVAALSLFNPVLDSIHRDPRFMRIMAGSRYARYWLETGHWPDFCSAVSVPYECAAEAAGDAGSASGNF